MSEKWLDHVKLLEKRIVLTDKQLAELLPTLPLGERIATVIGKYVGGAVSMHMNGENTCQQADARIAKYLLGKVKPWLSLSAPSTPASPLQETDDRVVSAAYVDSWLEDLIQDLSIGVTVAQAQQSLEGLRERVVRKSKPGSLASSPQEQPK